MNFFRMYREIILPVLLLTAIALLTMVGMPAEGADDGVEVMVSKKVREICASEGGCKLWTERQFRLQMEESFLDGVRSGERKADKGCGRTV